MRFIGSTPSPSTGKNPLATVHVRQWIYQPEGTDTLMTRLVITKMGMKVFEVTESIHHVDGGDRPTQE